MDTTVHMLFAQGAAACIQGWDLEDCPYAEDSDAAIAWELGFAEQDEVPRL